MAGVEEFLKDTAALPEKVTEISLEIFRRLALAAEAQVHGHYYRKSSFSRGWGLRHSWPILSEWRPLLSGVLPESLAIKPVPLGTGFIDCAHGRLPDTGTGSDGPARRVYRCLPAVSKLNL